MLRFSCCCCCFVHSIIQIQRPIRWFCNYSWWRQTTEINLLRGMNFQVIISLISPELNVLVFISSAFDRNTIDNLLNFGLKQTQIISQQHWWKHCQIDRSIRSNSKSIESTHHLRYHCNLGNTSSAHLWKQSTGEHIGTENNQLITISHW